MLLKDLEIGKRFMFEDRNTPLALAGIRGQISAGGVFVYVRVGENGCPVLKNEMVGKEVTVVPNTHYRYVLIII